MSESSESTLQVGQVDDGSEVPERLSKDDAGNVVSLPAGEEQPQRHSERTRTLTEKGKAMQEDKIKTLKQRFNYTYNKWRTHVKISKKALSQITEAFSECLMQDILRDVKGLSGDVHHVYEDLRRVSTPDQDTRRRVDICTQVSDFIVAKVTAYLDGKHPHEDEPDWPVAGSLWNSTLSELDSVTSFLKGPSERSNASSIKHQEAVAEAAASQAVLKVLEEQQREQLELQHLVAEANRKIAAQEIADMKRRQQKEQEEIQWRIKREEEAAEIKAKLEEKRLKIQNLETIKGLNAAQAKCQVYKQGLNIHEEPQDVLVADHQPSLPVRAPQAAAPQASQPTATSANPTTLDLIKMLSDAMSANRIPVPEPATFTGDPLKYSDWKLSFQTLIDQKNIRDREKIYYLRRYVSGQAKNALDGYFLLGTESAYAAAWELLEERYGSPFTVAKAYRDKLYAWPRIGARDNTELREFADFLRSCEAAMLHIKALEILNDCNENRKLLAKLPDWLTASWNRKVIDMEEENGKFPSFSQFVKFLSREAKIACNPVTSLYSLKQGEAERTRQPASNKQKQPNVNAKTLTTSSNEQAARTCLFCKKTGHTLHVCRKLLEKEVSDRVKFIQSEKLCFGCLEASHLSKTCSNRSVCGTCKKRHPTCLHEERDKGERKTPQVRHSQDKSSNQNKEKNKERTQAEQDKETVTASTHRVIQHEPGVQTAAIVPVWLSSAAQPTEEVLVYALLDSQSDTTFVLSEVADALDVEKGQVKLKLSTMTSTTVIQSQRVKNLQVRGFHLGKRITLPTSYTRDFIPANRTHIPTKETAEAWSHLEHLREHIAPLQSCEVGLLIGYNCSQALLPREVVAGQANQPFAQRTDLGWSIVGHGNPCVDFEDAVSISHRIVTMRVSPDIDSPVNLKAEVHYVNRCKVKEITPSDIIKILESDFPERTGEDDPISQDDLKFLSMMRENVSQRDDGHLEMPLPFKEEKPKLPDNRICAEHRLKCLERKLRKNETYYKDYVKFMNDILSRGDAEKIPDEEIEGRPAWYIPHHGVYHPQKPGKIRIVFDCSAKFQGQCLNDHLLTGPDLTNTLVGVLCRFRNDQVAVICDIERMFHQFYVKAEDQDYLRFLWWESGNLESTPSTYRMKVHLFGAASSPGCANFGLKHLAARGQGQYGEGTVSFIQRNFYVDDGLLSVPTEQEAIHLVKEARELCGTGKLRLHKFVSNNDNVMMSIPEEDRATIKDQDLALSLPHMERALGVEWCVTSDSFKFRVQVKSNPSTRRGVLSTVASVYDPLGLMAPFVLLGKQVLQQMCRGKIGWDEELPESLRPQWESWIKDLPNLSDMEIKRCYLPSHFGPVRRYELHHFCDASTTGYGVCTYLRAVSESNEVHCSLQELPHREGKVGEVSDEDPELRKATVLNTKAKEDRSLLNRLEKFSDWSRAVQAVARLKRLIKEHKGVKERTNESTSLEERKKAELTIVKLVQEEAFSVEIKNLKEKGDLTKTKHNKLFKLNPILDEGGVLRVGGRLSQAALHPHVRHPVIIPSNTHVASLLIKHFHERVHHQGRGMTSNELRANGWWILGSSSAVSSHIYKCVKCRKYRRQTEEQKMSDLPSDRMETAPPFTYTGIDCFGPFYVKEGRKEMKKYGLLLTCLCSRAIHVEMLDDMTTDAFINALRAFIAIRGSVRQLRSDQGTNFVGARREFAELTKGMSGERVKALGCEFSAQRLDGSSLRTLFYEVMAIVNSRPLTVGNLSDPSAPEPLTPNHILTMKSTVILPPPGQFVKEDLYLQKRWRKVQYLANEFWIRWRKEYLLSLQQREKWQKNRRNLMVNDIVLLQDDEAPRSEWKLARVYEVFPSSDGRVRKVKLLVSNTTHDTKGKPKVKTVLLDRPIQKVITLLEAE
ncbi:hypothetical protein N1851_017016 [Merluccius polli]|uniref:CCHC-type domain-containing protein n=1 Tax=Merluccius polli TaxID=89951 RepID=A0AA47MQK5_MERPO|nr:hypothetical protein N1851_017016 [Merluccius polli]